MINASSLTGWLIIWLTTITIVFSENSSEYFSEEEIRELFAGQLEQIEGRGHKGVPRLLSYASSPSWKAFPTFNLSMDISGCGYSVNKNTLAGIYTYQNGTTKYDATVGDILKAINEIANHVPDLQTAESRLSEHLTFSSKIVQARANRLLDGGLVCKSSATSRNTDVVHTELRRLL